MAEHNFIKKIVLFFSLLFGPLFFAQLAFAQDWGEALAPIVGLFDFIFGTLGPQAVFQKFLLWILFFAIIVTALGNVELFKGENKRRGNIVALVLSLMLIIALPPKLVTTIFESYGYLGAVLLVFALPILLIFATRKESPQVRGFVFILTGIPHVEPAGTHEPEEVAPHEIIELNQILGELYAQNVALRANLVGCRANAVAILVARHNDPLVVPPQMPTYNNIISSILHPGNGQLKTIRDLMQRFSTHPELGHAVQGQKDTFNTLLNQFNGLLTVATLIPVYMNIHFNAGLASADADLPRLP